MRCCVPFCRNTAANVRTAEGRRKDEGITFHGFPSEACLRAAWLRALGKQDTHLPDFAVVCSQHFLSDDFSETESGLRQIAPGAIPSTVLVCTMCLDSDSKQLPMSKYKLDEAYQQFIGLPLCDRGNLQQTLCVRCAHRLINVTRFRDNSLRTRSLMKDLVEKHEVITNQHIKMITQDQIHLKRKFVITTFALNYCDLHIVEEHDKDKQTESVETVHSDIVVVKTEDSLDAMSADENLEVKEEYDELDASNGQHSASDESSLWRPSLLDEVLQQEQALNPTVARLTRIQDLVTFPDETVIKQEFSAHMSMHRQTSDADSECVTSQVSEPDAAVSSGWHSAHLIEHNYAAQRVDDDSPPPTDVAAPAGISLSVATVDAEDGTLKKTKQELGKWTPRNVNMKQILVLAEHHNAKKFFVCYFCQYKSIHKNDLADHMLTHALENRKPALKKFFYCDFCKHKSTHKASLAVHIRTHTGEKPFSCNLCKYRGSTKGLLKLHMRTHTGEKPYSCKSCEFKCAHKSALVTHMRTHTGEKPYACNLCEFKASQRCSVVYHIQRIHSGEKRYTCKLCEYKCSVKDTLLKHIKRSHASGKFYSCNVCEFRSTLKPILLSHKRTHGEKPFSCNFCEYKCRTKTILSNHVRIHTGEKPYCCDYCGQKFAFRGTLRSHIRTHTGEKPYSCKLCNFKTAHGEHIITHMRTHTGEKPYSCKLCKYKSAQSQTLRIHMRTHTGEKPYSCKFCEFKCSQRSSLMTHMRAHTGDKPYSCQLCEYKCARHMSLKQHMLTHTSEAL
ncbi:zinc finger protein 431-like isoform X1 [Bicyclus anynana]|uniref:Zinc finger protein 431-like isoform X1 n=1 Tax=Bicyclus anynana TaxID=110368 RepID=A0ABM3M209_BICAN|nr:zinc finger protein 431-like isoform X1 [Bicyclus anynana]